MFQYVFKWWFENSTEKAYLWPKISVFEWSANTHDFTIWKLDTHNVWYSDESGIQMVTVNETVQASQNHLITALKSTILIPD